MPSNPSPPIDLGHQLTRGYAARMIRFRAVQIVGLVGLPKTDCDDLEQELRLHVLRRLEKFDPTIARWNTFVRVVTERHAATLIERLRRRSRVPDPACSPNPSSISVDAVSESPSTEEAKPHILARVAVHSTHEQQSDLAMDVQQVLSLLPKPCRRMCALLKLHSVAEAARLLGIPRTTLHDRLSRLRGVFRAAGIKKPAD